MLLLFHYICEMWLIRDLSFRISISRKFAESTVLLLICYINPRNQPACRAPKRNYVNFAGADVNYTLGWFIQSLKK